MARRAAWPLGLAIALLAGLAWAGSAAQAAGPADVATLDLRTCASSA